MENVIKETIKQIKAGERKFLGKVYNISGERSQSAITGLINLILHDMYPSEEIAKVWQEHWVESNKSGQW